MNKSLSGLIFGLLFIAFGVSIALNAFGYDVNIFFRGWWTLFIIIPSFVGLFQKNNRTIGAIGLGIGIMLLLNQQDLIQWQLLSRLIVALIFFFIGLSLVFKRNHFSSGYSKEYATNSPGRKNYSTYFGGREIRFDNEPFTGADLSVAFGAIEMDLRNAIITSDVSIQATCALGGIDIWVPANVRVEVDSTPILGGVDNRVKNPTGTNGMPVYTIYISATCILGGIDVK